MCSMKVTATCFPVTGGVKVGMALVHFSHQDWVSLDWFGQTTASQPFHSLTISIMNGFARLRFEFIIHNQRHTLAFESKVVTILAPVPTVSHQDGVCLNWFNNFTASQPFQCLIIGIMNGFARLRMMVYVLYYDHHNAFPVTGGVKVVLPVIHFWHQDWVSLDWFGQFTDSISNLPFSDHMYNEWFSMVEIWIHHPQPMPHPGFGVTGGDDFGSSSTLRFTPRWSMFGLIQGFHSISTLPMSHHKYNEWFEKVEIGICALWW